MRKLREEAGRNREKQADVWNLKQIGEIHLEGTEEHRWAGRQGRRQWMRGDDVKPSGLLWESRASGCPGAPRAGVEVWMVLKRMPSRVLVFSALYPRVWGGVRTAVSFIPASRVTTCPGLLGTSPVLAPSIPMSGTLGWLSPYIHLGVGLEGKRHHFPPGIWATEHRFPSSSQEARWTENRGLMVCSSEVQRLMFSKAFSSLLPHVIPTGF